MNENLIIEARQQFGLFFQELRESNGLSKEQVALFCGVTPQTIAKIELGKFSYSVDLLLKLSVVLNFTMNFEPKKFGNPKRFLLQKSQKEGYYTLTDTENQIVCSFQKGKFNETQKFTFLDDTFLHPQHLASIMKEFGDWVLNNMDGEI